MTNSQDILSGGWQSVTLTREQRESIWQEIEAAIEHVAAGKNPGVLSHQKLYRNAYDLVIDGSGSFLLDHVTRALGQQCIGICDRLRGLPSETSDIKLLEAYVSEVDRFKALEVMLTGILLYLERNYCQVERKPLVEHIAGFQLWRVLFEDQSASSTGAGILRAFQRLIEIARQQVKDTTMESPDDLLRLLGNVIRTASVFDMPLNYPSQYLTAFAEPYLKQWESECKSERAALKDATARLFVERTTRLRDVEDRLMNAIGANSSRVKAIRIWESVFLTNLPNLLSASDVDPGHLLDAKDLQFAKTLSCFVCTTGDGRSLLADSVETALETRYTQAIVAGTSLEDFTSFRADAAAFFNEAFDSSFGLDKALSRALVKVANKSLALCNRLADGLNDKIHSLSMARDLTGECRIAELRRFICCHVLEPFRVTRSKDAFECRYRQRLIIRILASLSKRDDSVAQGHLSLDLENAAVQTFLEECGAGFTHKITGFFEDLEASERFAAEQFPQHAGTFRVSVMSTFRWIKEVGGGRNPNFGLVPEMDEWRKSYESRYRKIYQTRRLLWNVEYGRGCIRFNVRQGRSVTIWASTLQCLILLLFNNARMHRVKWSEIEALLPTAERDADKFLLKKHFLGLCVAEPTRFIRRVKGLARLAELQADDEFEPNFDFVPDRPRLNAPVLSSKSKALQTPTENGLSVVSQFAGAVEGADSGDVLPSAILESRRGSVDAAIVRVMKARRRLHHAELVSLVNEEMSSMFLPSPAFVKSRIDVLLERDYIGREESDHTRYLYQA